MTTAVRSAVADAVASHVSWMRAQAALSPHGVWDSGSSHWAWSADSRSLHGIFPVETPPEIVGEVVERADALGAVEVSVWSAVDVERPELDSLGFQVGWQPCWMTAPTEGFDPGRVLLSRRAGLSVRARPHERHLQPLLDRDDVWRAEARSDARYAGRAWLHVTGEVAGLYDMAVWSRFRRQGLGRDLVTLLAATARDHGADRISLNATPEGQKLYSACGFSRVGLGRTWWRPLRDHRTGERL